MAETQGQKHSLTTEILMDFGKSITKTEDFAGKIETLGKSFNELSDSVEKIANDTDRMNLSIGEKISQAIADVKNGNIKINGKHIKDALETAIAQKITGGQIELEGNLHPITVKLTRKKWESMTAEVQAKMREAIENSKIDTRGKVAPFVFSNYGFLSLQQRFQEELHNAIEKRMEFAWGSTLKTMKDGTQQKVPKEMKFQVTSEDLKLLMDTVSSKFMAHITNPKNITFGEMAPIHFDSAKMNLAIEKIKNAIGDIDKHLVDVNFDELKKIPSLDKGMMNFKNAIATTVAQITELDNELKGLRLNAQEADLESVLGKIRSLRTTVVEKVGTLIQNVGEDIKTIPIGTQEYANYKSTLDNVGLIVRNHIQSEIDSMVIGLAARLGIDPTTGASNKTSTETNKWVASIRGIQELLVASAESAVKNLANADLGVDFDLIIKHFNEWSKQMRAKMLVDSQESLDKLTAQLTASNKEVLDSFAKAVVNVTSFRYDPSKIGEVQVNLPLEQIRPRVIAEIEEVVKEMVRVFRAVPQGEAGTVGNVLLPAETTDAINASLRGILRAQSEHLLTQLRGKDVKPSAEDVAELDAVMAQESKELIKLIVDQAVKNARTLAEGVQAKGFSTFTADDQAKIKAEMERAIKKSVDEFTEAARSAFGVLTMTAATTESLYSKVNEDLNRIIATTDVNFLDKDEPLVIRGAVTRIQKKLEEAVLDNITKWKPEAVPFAIGADAQSLALKNALHSMMQLASSKVIEGAGGIVEGTNAIFLDPKKLHKDVRRALATAENFDKVSDWEKAFKQGVDLEKATGQVMTEGVRQVMNRFHNAIAENTTSAISAYSDALGRVEIQPDLTSVHVMVRRVGEMMDNIQFRMIEALTGNLDAFYKGVIDGIKNLPKITHSIGYHPPAGATFVNSTPQPFPFGGAGSKTSTALVDPRFPALDRIPKGYTEFDMMQRWEREAQIRVLNTKNRFENSNLSQAQLDSLHDFLDNNYMARVRDAVGRYQEGFRVGDQTPYQTLRNAILDATLSLRYTVEQFRKLNLGATTQSNAAATMNKLTEYRDSSALKLGSIRTKFMGKLTPEQMGNLDTALDALRGKIESLANRDVINEQDITNAQVAMRQLRREIDLVSKAFDRVVKTSGIERTVDKLSEKLNRLMAGSLLPVNKLARLGDLINESYSDPTKISEAREYYADLVRENRQLNAEQRRQKSLQVTKNALNRDLESLRLDGLVDVSEINRIADLIERAIDPADIAEARSLKSELMAINRELKKQEELKRKRGEKIAESSLLKGDKAVFTEQLSAVLKSVDALKNYEITQMNVNNATNTWTVKLRDAEGNLRTLTGSIDKATGELFKHSEALQIVTQNAVRASQSIGSSIGRSGDILGNYLSNPMQEKRQNASTLSGFGTSVLNTMRYITAGAIMGYPTMLLHDSFQSAVELDYQLAKAKQNFEIKYLQPTSDSYSVEGSDGEPFTAPVLTADMTRLGETLVEGAMDALEKKYGGTLTEAQRKQEVANATEEVQNYLNGGVVKDIQTIALLNGISQEDVGLAYHIASRRYDNPYEATAFAREVAKVNAIEGGDIEDTATGFEAISSQWGINGYALQKVTNMMLMAANVSQAQIKDLIATQQRAGSMFRNAMGDMTKEDALAHSIAYSSMFVQATARSGAEAGTFWKAILEKPYTTKGREELANMAAMNPELYGNLNPYNSDGSQKDFAEIFANILETSANMNDESRIRMWQKLFPQWHMGSAAAVQAFTADLQHTMEKVMSITGNDKDDKDGDGKLNVQEAIEAYVNQIKGADENTARYIRAGLMDTWKFKQGQLKSSWEISTYAVWEQLKGEFSNLATYLSAFLRIVGDHASGIADTLGIIAKIMAGVGVKIAWNKFSEAVDNAEKKKNAKKIEGYGSALNENARMENLRRIGIEEEIANQQNRASARNTRRAEVNSKIVEREGEIRSLQVKRDEHQALYEAARANGDHNAASFHATERDNADNTARAKRQEIEQLRRELENLDAQDAKTKRSLESLYAELDDNGRAMTQLQNRAKALTLAMEDMGMDSSQLKNNLTFLNKEFQSGTVDVAKYDAEIKKIGKEAGLSDDNISKLKHEVDELNRSFRNGAMDATTYVTKMRELERAHLTGSLNVPGGGVASAGSASHSGMGLADAAMLGLLARDLLPTGGKRGLFGRVKDVIQTKSVKSLFNKNAPARGADGSILRDPNGKVIKQVEVDAARAGNAARAAGAADEVADIAGAAKKAGVLSKVAKGGRTLSKGLKLLKPMKGIPGLGWALMVGDLLTAAIDPLTAMGMTDAENKSIQAENKQELANSFKNFENASGIGKWLKGAGLVWDGAFSGLSHMLGGNSASWKDYIDGFKATAAGDAKYVEETLKEKYQYDKLANEAKMEQQMELDKKLDEQNKYHPLDTNKDGLLDPATDGTNQNLDYDSLDTVMSKISTELNKKLTHNESTFQQDRTRLLLSGIREDSDQIRKLTAKYLEDSIDFYDEAIKKLQDTYDLMADGDAKDKVGMELDNLKQQKAQTELELDSVKNSAIDELNRKMTDQLDLTKMDYDKRMYELLAKNGGNEDAPEIKALQKARVADVNSQLEGFKRDWDDLLKNGGFNPNSDEYMTILKNLKSIEVEQNQNLADINKNTKQSQSTFNLPSGLKVMDYFDYMTKNNTHKSVMVGAGNVTVHVNIDKMTGDTKDVEKLTAALESTLKKNNNNLVTQFANDVGAGMGTNYNPRR